VGVLGAGRGGEYGELDKTVKLCLGVKACKKMFISRQDECISTDQPDKDQCSKHQQINGSLHQQKLVEV
jgi:hypothetical protein